MRWWTMPDGRVLVEGAAEERILEGAPVAGAHTYYLFAADDTLLRTYEGYEGSVDEYLYVRGYLVRDGCLREIYRQVHDSGRTEADDDLTLAGLVPADPADTERLARLTAAIAEHERRQPRPR